MALCLAERLRPLSHPPPPCLPERAWQECQRLSRLAEKARSRGWTAAADRLGQRLRIQGQELLSALTRALETEAPPTPPATPRGLYAELLGLHEEFGEVRCNPRAGTVSVLTEPVVLDGVHLGPFRIELESDRGGVGGYTVAAVDPNPAAGDEGVTHPHVQEGHLCAGDGSGPIRRALEDGRLCDFFQIVDRVLHTYNPGSAYVELADWDGESCAACDDCVRPDGRTTCRASGMVVCLDCAVTCADCGHDFAPDPTDRCERCDESFCNECLSEGLCHACEEEARRESAARTADAAAAPGRGDDTTVPTLRFAPYAWAKLLYLRDVGDTEVGGFGISATDDLFLVEDVRLVQQRCTQASVEFEDEAVADFFDEQVDLGRRPEQFAKVWVHSHPGESAEPSWTDEDTFARAFGSSSWAVMFIVAKGGETYARLRFGCGPGAELLAPVAIAWDAPFPRPTTRPGGRSTTGACGRSSRSGHAPHGTSTRTRSPPWSSTPNCSTSGRHSP
jgi:proteasome lid subunit RPN8/RPN11